MSIKEENLWKILVQKVEKEDEKFQPDQKNSNQYLIGIELICNFGIDRAKTIRDTFPMYTLHDEAHICNVLRIMGQLLGNRADNLTRDEVAMLILAACCHDLGMSYTNQEKQDLLEDLDRLNHYLERNSGEYVKAYSENSDVPKLTDEMQRNYLRSIHHERISELLNLVEWPDCLWGKVDRDDLINVCQSHGNNPSTLNGLENSSTVDLRFCAILLRLADILDFDTTRAPKTLYQYSEFDNADGREAKISQTEWHKHMASQGFGFGFDYVEDRSVPYDLPYHATSNSMQIEQAVHNYLDWVDDELNQCGNLLRRYTGKWQNFVLPGKIKRTIKANGYVSGQYHLTMDQDKVMELLVGEELYSDPSAFVRELLQNAIDAVRTREQLDTQRPRNWTPQINIRSWMDDEGYHWFRIEDNGTGMSQDIVESYFLKIGKSYYTSDTFKKDKIRCGADPDYTPISRFGIGILSCFMGGKDTNQVEISTRRFATDGNRPSALRLSMHGMNGYYYLASQKEGHIPGPMKGVTALEMRPYLQNPGTVIAVRTNLYQTGKYAGFKEIVDQYVVYPSVPIHYDGPEGSFDYVTKKEFMEVVYNIQPSDDLTKQGVLEFSMTEEQLKEMKENFPGLAFNEPPKILLKCVPLDGYTKSSYLSGALLCAQVVNNPSTLFWPIGDETVEFDIIASITLDKEKENVGIEVSLHTREQNIHLPHKLKWLKNRYRTTLCCLKELPWYQTYFLNIFNRVGFDDVVAHNGVFCGNSKYLWETWQDKGLGSIVLFTDQYRPGVDISRSTIRELSLEMTCDLVLIQECLKMEGYFAISKVATLLKDAPCLIPTSDYRSLLRKRSDLEKRLIISMGMSYYTSDEINERILQQEALSLKWNIYDFEPFLSDIIQSIDRNPMDLTEQLQIVWLSNHCDLRMSMHGNLDEIHVRKKKESHSKLHSDIFPPSLFIYPDLECRYLTRDLSRNRHFCNADHRLAQFMLKNADLLQQEVPGILKEMIRTLQYENGEKLISGINNLLNRLRNLRNQPIQVPSDLCLTTEDLYYTKRNDSL